MVFDELVIGSGLSALGAVLGLLDGAQAAGRRLRIGVVTGPQPAAGGAGPVLRYQGGAAPVPCARLAPGGLGSLWHGVVPLAPAEVPALAAGHATLASLLGGLYPAAAAELAPLLAGVPTDAGEWLFVPRQPLRPWPRLRALAQAGRITLLPGAAAPLRAGPGPGQAVSAGGQAVQAARVWLAAGTLHTPGLLTVLAPQAVRGLLDDHVFCSLGRFDGGGVPAPARRCGNGLLLQALRRGPVLYSQRPALADFARLDAAIESRAVFAEGRARLVGGLLRRASPGLWAEALFNRFGLFAASPWRNAFAQVRVAGAWAWSGDSAGSPQARAPVIAQATAAARSGQPFDRLEGSRRPELWLPGIHLHHALDAAALQACGIDSDDSPLRVADASALADIGAGHPSLRVMARAHVRARQAVVRAEGQP